MRHALIAALMLLSSLATPATAAVSVSIGINLPVYPVLQRVPGYPVYYAPRVNSNYFFYDGLYWVYERDNWYTSPWYNGPWEGVDRFEVPVYLLRVPVRYYRSAPVYFRDWRADAPPRWGDHWGPTWEQRRSGWDQWSRSSAPAPAPLPLYQREYSGSRYPQPAQQVVIQTRSYRYEPRETVVQQHFQKLRASVPPSQLQPQREAPRRATQQPQAPSVRAQRSEGTGPPGKAKGWEGESHPPGKAKGWEGENRPPGKAKGWDKDKDKDDRDSGERGKGRDKDKEERGKGRDKEERGKGRDR